MGPDNTVVFLIGDGGFTVAAVALCVLAMAGRFYCCVSIDCASRDVLLRRRRWPFAGELRSVALRKNCWWCRRRSRDGVISSAGRDRVVGVVHVARVHPADGAVLLWRDFGVSESC